MHVDESKVSNGFVALHALSTINCDSVVPANLSRGPVTASTESRCGTVVEFQPRSGARPDLSATSAHLGPRGDVIRLDLYAARPRILRTAHDVWITTRTPHPSGILA